ncbi:MAG: hypothetical protein WD060_01750 [Pirellulales bacterium]
MPNGREYKQLASYKIFDGDAIACPVLSGNRLIVWDSSVVRLLTFESSGHAP